MDRTKWTSVDHYFSDALLEHDSILDEALKANITAGLPPHDVSPNQGKLLQILAQTQQSRRILEIGTLGGYSTIWMARALPKDGKLISLEVDASHAQVAQGNIQRAGLSNVVEIHVGNAIDTLPLICSEGGSPFDLVFIDADKASNADYFTWALKMSRKGSLIIIDNVVRNGAVVDASSADPSVQGVRRLNKLLAKESRVTATVVQTVGTKGWDGFIIVRVL